MGNLGATQLALAYATSAVLLFLLRDWIGRDSALFSVPTRFWPPLIFLIALVAQFTPARQPALNNTQKAVAALQVSVPRMLGEKIRIDRIAFDGSALHYYATSMGWLDVTGTEQTSIEQQVRKLYCENLKALRLADISIEFQMSVPPRSLSDRVNTYSLIFYPKECQPATH